MPRGLSAIHKAPILPNERAAGAVSGPGAWLSMCSGTPEVGFALFLERANRFFGVFRVHSGEFHAQRERQNHARYEPHVIVDGCFRGHDGLERPSG